MRTFSVLLFVALLPTKVGASPADLRLLGDAPLYVLIEPRTAHDLTDDLRAALSGRRVLGRPVFDMVVAQLSATLGFDPTRRAGLVKIGIDPDRPLLLALAAHDAARLADAIARKPRRPAGSKRAGPEALVLMGQRLVAQIADAKRLRAFLAARTVSVVGDAAKATKRLAGFLRLPSSSGRAGALLTALRGQKVEAVARLDGRSLVCLRRKGKRLVVDLLQPLAGGLTSNELAARIAVRLQLGPGPTGELAARAFAGKPGVAALLRAAPARRLARLVRQRDLGQLAAHARGRGKAELRTRRRAWRRCEAGWRAVGQLTGDAALRGRARGSDWELSGWWQASPRLVAALKRAGRRRPRVDPSAFTDAVAMGATNLDIGLAGRALAAMLKRWGPRYQELVRDCGPLALVGLATGGWVAAGGAAYVEAGRDRNLTPLRGHLRHAIGAVRAGGGPVVEWVLGGLSSGRARTLIAGLPRVGPEAGGLKTPDGEAELRRLGQRHLAIRSLGGDQTAVAAGLLADLRWFVARRRSERPVLPPSILVYGQADLARLLVQAGHLAPLAKRLGRLGANLSVDGHMLSLELHVQRK